MSSDELKLIQEKVKELESKMLLVNSDEELPTGLNEEITKLELEIFELCVKTPDLLLELIKSSIDPMITENNIKSFYKELLNTSPDSSGDCELCDHRVNNPDPGWCYMFNDKMEGCKIWRQIDKGNY
jgi:hypothetical protein